MREIHHFIFIYRSVIVCEDSDQLIALVQQQNGVDVTNTVKKGEDSRLVDPDAVLATEVNSEKRPKFLYPLGKISLKKIFFFSRMPMTKNKPDWPPNADHKDPFSGSEVAHPDPDLLADPTTDFSPDSRSFSSLFSNATYLLFNSINFS